MAHPYATRNEHEHLERRVSRLERMSPEARADRLQSIEQLLRKIEQALDALKEGSIDMITKAEVQRLINDLRNEATRDSDINSSALKVIAGQTQIIAEQVKALADKGADAVTQEDLDALQGVVDKLRENQDGLAAAIPAGTPAPAIQTGDRPQTHPIPEQPNPSTDGGTEQPQS